MMMKEFEELTGIEPTAQEEYNAIEIMYYEFDGDKKAFCKWFVENNGMVTALRMVVKEQASALQKKVDELHEMEDLLRKNTAECDRLAQKLEKEEEWEPFELEENVKQADYDRLNSCSSRRELTDKEAIDEIADKFGFDRSKIRIVHSVDQYEKNRHGRLRSVGKIERKALYDATDWNYIRFDVACWRYEMHNGNLRQFYA